MSSLFLLISLPEKSGTKFEFFVGTWRGVERKSFSTMAEAQTEFNLVETALALSGGQYSYRFKIVDLSGRPEEFQKFYEDEFRKFSEAPSLWSRMF